MGLQFLRPQHPTTGARYWNQNLFRQSASWSVYMKIINNREHAVHEQLAKDYSNVFKQLSTSRLMNQLLKSTKERNFTKRHHSVLAKDNDEVFKLVEVINQSVSNRRMWYKVLQSVQQEWCWQTIRLPKITLSTVCCSSPDRIWYYTVSCLISTQNDAAWGILNTAHCSFPTGAEYSVVPLQNVFSIVCCFFPECVE